MFNKEDDKKIIVRVLNTKGQWKPVTCDLDQHKVVMPKKKNMDAFSIPFNPRDVTDTWQPGIIRGGYKRCIHWREGTDEAISMDVTDTFLPALSQPKAKQYIKKAMSDALTEPKNMLETWQFWVLFAAIIAVIVLGALNLFGVHFNVGSTTTVTQIITSTPTPTPIHIGP